MSITDELREYASLCPGGMGGDALRHIADRIDAAVDGMVKLPVDADGVPIHVGDELTDGIDLPAKVLGMVMGKDGWAVGSRVLGVDGMVDPTTLHHVHRDSWERIIEDAANLVRGDNESVVELVERCRRLAGEA